MEDHSRPHELTFPGIGGGYSSRPFSARYRNILDEHRPTRPRRIPLPSRRAELLCLATGAVRARRREHHALPRVLTRRNRAPPQRREKAGRSPQTGSISARGRTTWVS